MARSVSPTELSDSPPPSSKNLTNDDWTCEDCENINFARRNNCNRCNKPRTNKRKLGTEIGKAAAEKSGGLFNAEDWQCYKCANVNWARRQQCNVCNTPKFAVLEERTGFGGGYNDRGVVEYKDREDSDDEYDEFGRRKKPRTESSRSRKDSEEIQKKIEEENEEEEEEDGDDDGDLSKYDLSDFGGPDDSKETNQNSRSRSKSPK